MHPAFLSGRVIVFDKQVSIDYTIGMNTRTRLCLILSCLVVGTPVVALPLSTQLSFTSEAPQLAQDARIGVLVQPESGSSEAYTAEALTKPYSLDWVEKYVSPDVRFSFVRSFDKELALLLPQTLFSLGKAIKGEDTISVPFRYGKEMRYGTFVWVEISEGTYTLVSITLNP